MALIDGLVSYWKLDELAGDADDAHDANDGTVTGATQGVAGKINTAYSFDGSDDFVQIADSANLSALSPLSIAFWWKGAGASDDYMIYKGNSAGGYDIEFRIYNGIPAEGGVSLAIFDPSQSAYIGRSDASSSLFNGDWHYFVGTWSGGTTNASVKIYIDGTQTDDGNVSGGTFVNIEDTGNPLYLMRGVPATNFAAGVLDELGIWKKELSQAEVIELYNGGAGLAYPFAPPVGTNIKINISDAFKDVSEIKTNIGDAWKAVNKIQVNIGDAWKTVFG